MGARVAVVTGANRGIGLEICRQIGSRGDVRVVLTSRDDSKGRTAAKKLAASGADVEFRSLDITKERSVKALADFLASAHGGCDVLVNNAGILADPRGSRFLESTVDTYR